MHIYHNNYIISVTRIIGTSHHTYAVYEPSSYTGPHASLQRFDGIICGDIASHRKHGNANQRIAYETILEAFPMLRNVPYEQHNGHIETWETI